MSQGEKHTAEQIISKLREAEIAISQGQTAASAAKSIGVTAQTYFRWRKSRVFRKKAVVYEPTRRSV